MNSNPLERNFIMETNTIATTETATTEATTEQTDQAIEAVTSAAAAPTPAPVKTVRYTIYQDIDGVELKRVISGRGRPARNSTIDADGNRIVTGASLVDGEIQLANAKPVHVDTFYITVDDNGSEVSRKMKGRGRNTPGYILHTQGAFAGHWVGKPIPKAEKVATVVTAAATASETQVTAPTDVVDQSEEKVTGACPHLSAV